MRIWISVVLGAAALGCLFILFSWRSRDHLAAASAHADLTTSPSDLTALRRDVELLKARSKTPQVLLVGAGEPKQESVESPMGPEEEKAAGRERLRQIGATLEHKFTSEAIDRDWSAQRSRDIRDAVTAEGPSTAVSSLTCAATLCKLVLDHDTIAAQREMTAKLGDLEPFHAGVFYDHDQSATPPRTTLYVLREGHDFSEVFANH